MKIDNRGLPLSVLIAPDKFKGTLTAEQAAKAIARGWKTARPKDHLTELPISDGGDGFGPLLAHSFGANSQSAPTRNAAGQPIKGLYWVTSNETALVESANIIGLAMLPESHHRPLQNDSAGLGIILRHVEAQSTNQCIIGIGGSATNDGGFGVARELGWLFLDRHSQEILQWPNLVELTKIVPPQRTLSMAVTVAVDVLNPLLGPNGCTRVYAPQKGLKNEEIEGAEAALARLAEVWEIQMNKDAASLAGAGAAGGLGFGLHCFARAEIRSGFEIFAEAAQLDTLLCETDLVVTGEGAMDRQTVMGKGVGQLAQRAGAHDCQCIGLAGMVEDRPALSDRFAACYALNEIAGKDEAHNNAAHWLEKIAHQSAEVISELT